MFCVGRLCWHKTFLNLWMKFRFSHTAAQLSDPLTLSPNIQTICELLLRATYLLVFQMWMVSGSVMLCCRACSSNKSKKYLTARGTGRLVLRIAVNKSSTNFCSVPWDRAETVKLSTRCVHKYTHIQKKSTLEYCSIIFFCDTVSILKTAVLILNSLHAKIPAHGSFCVVFKPPDN